MYEYKQKIETAIKDFGNQDGAYHFFDTVINLFDILGYKTDRQARLEVKSFSEFEELYVEDNVVFTDLNKKNKFYEKAFTDKWESMDILFQITDQEMKTQLSIFESGMIKDKKNRVEVNIYSYLFMGIVLKDGHYTRTALADITRQVNKLFSMPVVIVFKLGNTITISMIKRRVNKKDGAKDVLEKVTLIKDININNPHRAHTEIFCDLSFEKLKKEYALKNFKDLQDAWKKVLDTKKLNNNFYKKIASWYDWAEDITEYPNKSPEAINKYKEFKSLSIIRLLNSLYLYGL